MITYTDILLKGFIFDQVEVSQELEKEIWSQKFEVSTKGSSVSFHIKSVNLNIVNKLRHLISSKTEDPYLLELINSFRFDANKMIQNDFMDFHNEVSQKSPVEVIFWLPKENEYQGRDFLMEINSEVKMFHPLKGSVCFLDTTSPTNRHGVSTLLSDTEIISIVGGLGRKYD